MAIAGTLAVNIIAQTLGFQRGITRARKELTGFRKDTKRADTVMKGLTRTLGALFGGLSIRAGFNFLRNQLEIADAMAKTAETLDLTTEKLGLFQLAANTAGVDTRQLNISIQRMSRRIGEAALGSGELSKTLIRLGIDAQALSRLSVGDQFLEMGKSLEAITNQDERLAAIFKTFDSEGVPVFRVFGQNLEDAKRAYERFNLALKQTDAQTLEKISTQATILKEAFGAAGRNFLIDISPEVLKAIGALQNILSPPGKEDKRLGETAKQEARRRGREQRGEGEPFSLQVVDRIQKGLFGKGPAFDTLKGIAEVVTRTKVGLETGSGGFTNEALERRRQRLIARRQEFADSPAVQTQNIFSTTPLKKDPNLLLNRIAEAAEATAKLLKAQQQVF